ncbi:MAG TPA: dihydrofolate reductase family protein, partial [Candidatus Eisenbacteria bacterium]|nr:dihydrofolate reductase family protein [Candidatus Eisenbacteria bacterium]
WWGWWGPNPPYHRPVFVLTHFAHEPLVMEGGTTFHFVTDGIHAALERAKEAAGDLPVHIAGGPTTTNQYLAAGLVDEMEINVVPILLGAGERLFENLGNNLHGLELRGTVAMPNVTHFKFARSGRR